MKSEWRPVRVIILSLVIDLLGFTVILPLLPSMLQYYSITDKVSEHVIETKGVHVTIDRFV